MIIFCKVCSKEFNKPQSLVAKGYAKYCSRKCEVSARPNPPVDRICLQCGISFKKDYWSVNVLKNGGKFCSRTCTDIFKRKLRKRGEKNMFTNWQKREWMDSKCVRCEATEELELDHIIPRFAGGLPIEDNAQTLCRTCNLNKFWQENYSM